MPYPTAIFLKLRSCGFDTKPLVVVHWSKDKFHTYSSPHLTFPASTHSYSSLPKLCQHHVSNYSLYANYINTLHSRLTRLFYRLICNTHFTNWVPAKYFSEKWNWLLTLCKIWFYKSMSFRFLLKNQKIWQNCAHSQMVTASSCPEMLLLLSVVSLNRKVRGNTMSLYLSISHKRAL